MTRDTPVTVHFALVILFPSQHSTLISQHFSSEGVAYEGPTGMGGDRRRRRFLSQREDAWPWEENLPPIGSWPVKGRLPRREFMAGGAEIVVNSPPGGLCRRRGRYCNSTQQNWEKVASKSGRIKYVEAFGRMPQPVNVSRASRPCRVL